MHTSYEYILVGVLIFVTLSATQLNMVTLVSDRLTHLEQEVTDEIAVEILDSLLLAPGVPQRWGGGVDLPQVFGLATPNSVKEYTLDPLKVYRLCEQSDEYLPPSQVRDLLGLSRSHHFSLRFVALFNISVHAQGAANYTITARSYRDAALPNVRVTGYYFNLSDYGASFTVSDPAMTDLNGRCQFAFDAEPDHALLVHSEFLGDTMIATVPDGLMYTVTNGVIFSSYVPPIENFVYRTASVFGITKGSAFRNVRVGDQSFRVEFELWS
jgi:hypothetical protein